MDWDPDTESSDQIIRRLDGLLAEDPGHRIAVVAEGSAPVLDLAAVFECRTAGPEELMLTEDEVGDLCRDHPTASLGAGRLSARQVHGSTGGWLMAVQAMLDGPVREEAAHRPLVGPLARWLRARDPSGAMAETSFLPEFSAQILDEFQPEGGPDAPTLEDLTAAGILRRDGRGHPFMPVQIRNALQEWVRESNPDRVDVLAREAVYALMAADRVEQAVETAATGRTWTVLRDVLVNRWADLFTSDARVLRAFASRFPTSIRSRQSDLNVALRILSLAGPDSMVLPLPSVEPELQHDRTAHRLRERSSRAYRSPDAFAVTYGLLEISYLRLSGHFMAAADAAVRLRRALETGLYTRPISPALASIAELHAGICLHLADCLPEAQAAYRAALDWARSGDNHAQEADALAKLALVQVQLGETRMATGLLEEMTAPLSRVGWGRKMVGRAGHLAQAWAAVEDLDLARAEEILSDLPPEPDTDEYWSVHAALLATIDALQGRGERAIRRVAAWRLERPFAAAAPMADRLLTEVTHRAATLMGRTSEVPGWERNPALANVQAVRRLRNGSPDEAIAALQIPPRSRLRDQQEAALLQICVEGWPLTEPDSDALRRMASVHGTEGATIDLLAPVQLGLLPLLRSAGVVDEVRARRLSAVPLRTTLPDLRPQLTPREREVLGFLRQGLTRKQIAGQTIRSENTVKAQLSSLYAKLGASSAQEALSRARDFGF
ncbi:LuxR C-terminal-related transcriptional regulator [Citricoccus sp. NPDC055426]|uniref:LuxR C-terminal-related transcriptional regulator n=1 Tax=Citricoccus sp. NPDC055426 TaxID=3155536 RepID=UPI0034309FC4